jgi:Trypsin-like peptidase domain
MKHALVAMLLALLALTPTVQAQKSQVDLRERLSEATLALYTGKQACQYVATKTFFGPMPVWTCSFETHFICTATVVRSDDGDYLGLTAGHCFDYDETDAGFKYYVSEGVEEHPVLREITVLKFENNDQYDYGVFSFHSAREYPAIQVESISGADVIPALGTRVLNNNFSYGLVKEVTEGIVVSKQIGEREAVILPEIRRRYLVQMPFGPGASGSPIVNEETGKIIGMVEANFPSTQMAAVVIPTGKNFADFIEDDSVGLKPQPEPKTPKAQPSGDSSSFLDHIRSLFKYYSN